MPIVAMVDYGKMRVSKQLTLLDIPKHSSQEWYTDYVVHFLQMFLDCTK